jgi:hypothetical protein
MKEYERAFPSIGGMRGAGGRLEVLLEDLSHFTQHVRMTFDNKCSCLPGLTGENILFGKTATFLR